MGNKPCSHNFTKYFLGHILLRKLTHIFSICVARPVLILRPLKCVLPRLLHYPTVPYSQRRAVFPGKQFFPKIGIIHTLVSLNISNNFHQFPFWWVRKSHAAGNAKQSSDNSHRLKTFDTSVYSPLQWIN